MAFRPLHCSVSCLAGHSVVSSKSVYELAIISNNKNLDVCIAGIGILHAL